MDNVTKKNNMPVDPSSSAYDITPTLLPSSSSSSSLHTGKSTITAVPVPVQTTMSFNKLKTEVEQLDDLVKDLLNEVNETDLRTTSPSPSPARVSSSNGTGIRIKPGPSRPIPVQKSHSQSVAMAASLDEQLIDSLLESVQNTLRKRAMLQMPKNRRTYSSSSAYTDSIHRMDPSRGRYPIKLYRNDSPASTLSSRRPSHRSEYPGYPSTAHRATSEPPPEGPIQLHRMDLIRSPSRTYFEPPTMPPDYPFYHMGPPPGYYRTVRHRYYEPSGYESDATRVYPPPSRPIYRSDGYETDSGLISSGRIRMSRPVPTMSASTSRMAVIPETNRIHPNREKRDFNQMEHEIPVQRQTRTRSEDFDRQRVQREPITPAVVIPIQTEDEQKIKAEKAKKDLLNLLSSSVGLSNPIDSRAKILTSSSTRSESNGKPTVKTTVASVPTVAIDVPITKASSSSASTDQHIYKNIDSTNSNTSTRTETSTMLQTQEETSPRSSIASSVEVDPHRQGIYQAHNVSRFWYKEKMSRDDAIHILKHQPPGTFLVRDSQGFPGSFGLAVKVQTLPPGIQPKPNADREAELVRHYLIERTSTGHVRLKGYPNEPEFASLSALVYHHTINALALPIKLVLPTTDIAENYRPTTNTQSKKPSSKELLSRGAACQVVYLNNVNVGSLTDQQAVSKALAETFNHAKQLQPTIVQFKVSNNGITLNDTKKKIFSHRHFPTEHITYCALDHENGRYWNHKYSDLTMLPSAKCFGFVSKKMKEPGSSSQENECHIFAELDPLQPSSAIVNFVSKVLIGSVSV